MAMAQAMSDRVRDVGDGLILGFPISTTEVAQQDLETVRLYFFRVSSQTRYFQKHTSLSSINSGNTSPSNGFDLVVSTDDFVVIGDVVDTEQIFIGKNRIFLIEDRKRIIARLGARVGNGPVFSSIIAECIRLLLA